MTTTLASHSATSSAAPGAFYARWVDHSTWPEWDPDTAWCRVEGPVVAGARGRMKPVGGPAVRFVVAVADPAGEYTDVSRLLGARLTFRHVARVEDGVTRLEAVATLDGPLAWVWATVMGAGFRASVPAALERLVALVEGRAAVAA